MTELLPEDLEGISAAAMPVLIGQERVNATPDWLLPQYGEAATAAMLFEATQYQSHGEIDRLHAAFLTALTGNATIPERDTWKPKEDAARAILNGSTDATFLALLQPEAEVRGITVQAFCVTVLAKAAAYYTLCGLAGKIKAAAHAGVELATNPTELEAALTAAKDDITPAAIADAQQAAEAAAAAVVQQYSS